MVSHKIHRKDNIKQASAGQFLLQEDSFMGWTKPVTLSIEIEMNDKLGHRISLACYDLEKYRLTAGSVGYMYLGF